MDLQRTVGQAIMLCATTLLVLALVPTEVLAFDLIKVKPPNQTPTPSTLRQRSKPIEPGTPKYVGPKGPLPSPGSQQHSILPPTTPGPPRTGQAPHISQGALKALATKPPKTPKGFDSPLKVPTPKGGQAFVGPLANTPMPEQVPQKPAGYDSYSKGKMPLPGSAGMGAEAKKGEKSGYYFSLEERGEVEPSPFEADFTGQRREQADPFHTAPSPTPPGKKDDDGDPIE